MVSRAVSASKNPPRRRRYFRESSARYFVCLVGLSRVVPFCWSNYLFGLTEVRVLPYIAGTWIGTLPAIAKVEGLLGDGADGWWLNACDASVGARGDEMEGEGAAVVSRLSTSPRDP